jgi:hypothetical protein
MEEAVEGIRAVESDYPRHGKAARLLAGEYFDSNTVLKRLIEDATDTTHLPPASNRGEGNTSIPKTIE